VLWAISEHIENAGVPRAMRRRASRRRSSISDDPAHQEIAKDIAAALQITGPFNIQFPRARTTT